MTAQVEVHLGRAEGSLIRLLGTAERRGYNPIRVSSFPLNHRALRVRLTVESQRPLDQLLVQLDKLYDVFSVQRVR